MVSAALLRLADHPSHRPNSALRKFGALFATVDFALHLEKNGRVPAEKKKMASYTQVGFVSSALLQL